MAPLMSLCLFFFFSFILAAPLDTRTVYAPPITNPTSSSVWTVGEVETVTWNATGIPAGVTGQIQLGYLTPGNEHLSVILASGFNLTDEKVNVTVPAVVSRTNYIVVLFGDSGNISPTFTIQGSTSASGSASTGTSLTLTGTDQKWGCLGYSNPSYCDLVATLNRHSPALVANRIGIYVVFSADVCFRRGFLLAFTQH
ncbi:hypothetical protein B0H11DRAFT_2186623 [Mycena galericulata]|nr:hypothetical protein B0H11DRAFT_2186623 [Mycena galericulata]